MTDTLVWDGGGCGELVPDAKLKAARARDEVEADLLRRLMAAGQTSGAWNHAATGKCTAALADGAWVVTHENGSKRAYSVSKLCH